MLFGYDEKAFRDDDDNFSELVSNGLKYINNHPKSKLTKEWEDVFTEFRNAFGCDDGGSIYDAESAIGIVKKLVKEIKKNEVEKKDLERQLQYANVELKSLRKINTIREAAHQDKSLHSIQDLLKENAQLKELLANKEKSSLPNMSVIDTLTISSNDVLVRFITTNNTNSTDLKECLVLKSPDNVKSSISAGDTIFVMPESKDVRYTINTIKIGEEVLYMVPIPMIKLIKKQLNNIKKK